MKIDERHLIQLAAVVQAGGVTEGARAARPHPAGGVADPVDAGEAAGRAAVPQGPPAAAADAAGTSAGRTTGRQCWPPSRKASATGRQLPPSGSSGVVRVGGTPFFMDALICRHDRRVPAQPYPDSPRSTRAMATFRTARRAPRRPHRSRDLPNRHAWRKARG